MNCFRLSILFGPLTRVLVLSGQPAAEVAQQTVRRHPGFRPEESAQGFCPTPVSERGGNGKSPGRA